MTVAGRFFIVLNFCFVQFVPEQVKHGNQVWRSVFVSLDQILVLLGICSSWSSRLQKPWAIHLPPALRGNPEVFPGQPGGREESGGSWDRCEPPQLAPLYMEERRLYSELLTLSPSEPPAPLRDLVLSVKARDQG